MGRLGLAQHGVGSPPAFSVGQEPVMPGLIDCFGLRLDLKLAIDAAYVGLHSVRRQFNQAGNLVSGKSFGDKL